MFNLSPNLGNSMKTRLTAIQLEYVLEHIGHHIELHKELRQALFYGKTQPPDKPAILFPAAENELNLDDVIYIDHIPVLYPLEKGKNAFYTLDSKSLYFHHDLLKSIFHFLSGYEEVKNGSTDQYGRFPFIESLPYKLKIIDRPVVNYYMEIIMAGIEEFCKINKIPYRKNPVFSKPVLMLSHDIDLINAYSFKETAFKFKQLMGLASSPYNFSGKFQDAFTALYHLLNPLSTKNPYWNFRQLTEWEAERGIRSSYYFLEKDGKYENSYYHFHQKRIIMLFRELSEKGHELGIHGTMQSYDNLPDMIRTVEHLRAVSPQTVDGIRQHFLRFRPNHTAQIQAEAGLAYDATLGFAEHEGFRNSYCWPFKFYDFSNNRIMNHWEIPLTLMDVTHFYYRKLNFEQSMESVQKLTAEVVKFNGIFSLLWHNSFFNEREFPGITNHYTKILDLLISLGMEGIPGREIFKLMQVREAGKG